MAKKATRDLDGDILKATMTLAAREGWLGLSLREVAAGAGIGLDELRGRISGTSGLLRLLSKRLDTAMLAADQNELAELEPRERLFELLMLRFDAMTPYKQGLVRLGQDMPRAPELLAQTLCNLDRTARWLLEAADIRYPGPRARLARRLLTAAYLSALRVWVRDDSEDQAKTLAELDKRLSQLERLARFGRVDLRRAKPDDPAEAASPA